MALQIERSIFRRASTTYYWSSRFFPAAVRADVFRLYGFVRVADDYVDTVPAQRRAFMAFRAAYEAASANPDFKTMLTARDSTDTRVIKHMISLQRRYAFDPAWVEAFLDAMQSDLDPAPIQTLDECERYMYGSAEVIGLMLAKIMKLPPEAAETARLQGRAMQYINFIRDIAEDNSLGRQYLPQEDLERFGLSDLSEKTVLANQAAFTKLIRFELARYRKWQAEAAAGYGYIPPRMRIAVRTAADMYDWTARQIDRDPLMVFVRKIKPTKRRVVGRALANVVR